MTPAQIAEAQRMAREWKPCRFEPLAIVGLSTPQRDRGCPAIGSSSTCRLGQRPRWGP